MCNIPKEMEVGSLASFFFFFNLAFVLIWKKKEDMFKKEKKIGLSYFQFS